MRLHHIFSYSIVAAILSACTGASEFRDNGTFAATAANTTLTPGSSTIVTSTYTITTKVQMDLGSYPTTFTTSRPDLITIGNVSALTSGAGIASTTVNVKSDTASQSLIPAGGLDVTVTAAYNTMTASVIIHVNPSITTTTAGNSVIYLTSSPAAGTTFSAETTPSITVTATTTPPETGISISFSVSPLVYIGLRCTTNSAGVCSTAIGVAGAYNYAPGGTVVSITATDGSSTSQPLNLTITP